MPDVRDGDGPGCGGIDAVGWSCVAGGAAVADRSSVGVSVGVGARLCIGAAVGLGPVASSRAGLVEADVTVAGDAAGVDAGEDVSTSADTRAAGVTVVAVLAPGSD